MTPPLKTLCSFLITHTRHQSVIRTSVTHSAVPYVPLFCCNPIWHHLQLIRQLLEEVVHNIMKYQCQGMSYLPKQKAEADNADMKFDKNSVNQIFFFSCKFAKQSAEVRHFSLSSKHFENTTCAWMKGLETSQTLNLTW